MGWGHVRALALGRSLISRVAEKERLRFDPAWFTLAWVRANLAGARGSTEAADITSCEETTLI